MDHAKSYFMRESNMLLVARQPSRQSCSQLKRKFKEKTKPLKILIIFQETTTNHFQNINNSSSKKNYPHHDLVHRRCVAAKNHDQAFFTASRYDIIIYHLCVETMSTSHSVSAALAIISVQYVQAREVVNSTPVFIIDISDRPTRF